ncbi:MAG: RodZ domain-containing protein [Burkholderiaceae bacterium]
MSDGPSTISAGALLRRAREHKGTSVATLASSLKVAPAKLDALEADRLDALPDLAFARALAQSVCRHLQLDPAPVLAALPRPSGQQRLEQVAQGLNTPFMERPGRFPPDEWSRLAASPLVWAALFVLIAAGAVYFAPIGWTALTPNVTRLARPAATAAVVESVALARSSAVPASDSAATTLTETVYSVPLDSVAASASGAARATTDAAGSTTTTTVTTTTSALSNRSAASGTSLQIRTSAESWVEVSDAQGRALMSRIVLPGESIGLDGALPLHVRIGNAAGTEVVFRGQPFALSAYTRDNIARFDLK